jgi:hypothetical protein
MLLTRKDILRHLNKERNLNKRPSSYTVKPKMKRNIIVNVNLADNHQKVNDYMKQSDSLNRSKDLIVDEINKQENSFRQRLEEKKKSKLSSSFIMENNDSNVILN